MNQIQPIADERLAQSEMVVRRSQEIRGTKIAWSAEGEKGKRY